eukprot:Blabericola_migrator_1__456@NODE_110_length_13983_cov_82_900618_g98_i0_p4_GENE_NODE_110_length_13983_cov_82_900618_g98_i0NODE_110_length_13983_cov_82_900618_g98_i0_p4_ORF_typecomplete_len551_score48_76CRAL_TRIO/PF00650_20/0_0055_NODE_110_length_13983_cov_82_900618_g98_i01175813410
MVPKSHEVKTIMGCISNKTKCKGTADDRDGGKHTIHKSNSDEAPKANDFAPRISPRKSVPTHSRVTASPAGADELMQATTVEPRPNPKIPRPPSDFICNAPNIIGVTCHDEIVNLDERPKHKLLIDAEERHKGPRPVLAAPQSEPLFRGPFPQVPRDYRENQPPDCYQSFKSFNWLNTPLPSRREPSVFWEIEDLVNHLPPSSKFNQLRETGRSQLALLDELLKAYSQLPLVLCANLGSAELEHVFTPFAVAAFLGRPVKRGLKPPRSVFIEIEADFEIAVRLGDESFDGTIFDRRQGEFPSVILRYIEWNKGDLEAVVAHMIAVRLWMCFRGKYAGQIYYWGPYIDSGAMYIAGYDLQCRPVMYMKSRKLQKLCTDLRLCVTSASTGHIRNEILVDHLVTYGAYYFFLFRRVLCIKDVDQMCIIFDFEGEQAYSTLFEFVVAPALRLLLWLFPTYVHAIYVTDSYTRGILADHADAVEMFQTHTFWARSSSFQTIRLEGVAIENFDRLIAPNKREVQYGGLQPPVITFAQVHNFCCTSPSTANQHYQLS